MDPKIETRIARDVEKHLSRLLTSYPKLARLPIAPLFSVSDLIRLEFALERFAQSHGSVAEQAACRSGQNHSERGAYSTAHGKRRTARCRRRGRRLLGPQVFSAASFDGDFRTYSLSLSSATGE